MPEHGKASAKIQGTYEKEKQYECQKCKLKLENKKNLRDHVCNTQKKIECECCGYEFLSELHLKHHKELITEKALNLVNYVSSISIENPAEKVKHEDITLDYCDDCGLTMLLDSAHTEERCDKNQYSFYDKISLKFNAEVLNVSKIKAVMQKAIEENWCTYSCNHLSLIHI